MSEDNGIYIISHKGEGPEGKEYRVTHCSSIEDIDFPELGQLYEVWKFGRAKIHRTLKNAKKFARRLQREIDYTEYGIYLIDREHKWLSISVFEAKRRIDEWWKTNKENRDEV